MSTQSKPINTTCAPVHLHTPPDSFTTGPPTQALADEKERGKPSVAVLQVLDAIRCRRRRNRSSLSNSQDYNFAPWQAFQLDAEEYRDLLFQLQGDQELAGYMEDKVRSDYFPLPGRFILRMPGPIHESFCSLIEEEIWSQLQAIGEPSAEFAHQIRKERSTTIKSSNVHCGPHDPDAQFRHRRAKRPGVVVEVSHSQKVRDLPRLADEYIIGSGGDIGVVVAFDIEYKKSKKATVSVWKPAIELEDGERCLISRSSTDKKMFRDENGNAIADDDLRIPLSEFAPQRFWGGLPLLEEIVIPFHKLYAILVAAEEACAVRKENSDDESVTTPCTKWRFRHSTPEEKLETQDENRYRDEEAGLEDG
ncbi:hypothetical protein QTJ16_004690 [Diplocarpon rosae]|uniref:Uncharacterized protein n=1 Tax=Diplocarpon rosae TaxID=946125 RepID=A0AAD9T077_9HELO|nr:hypothetical protein QTJ16_004690 [Diplocarpon rosae]